MCMITKLAKGLGLNYSIMSVMWLGSEGKRGMVLIAHPKAYWATRSYRRFGFECIATTRDQVLRVARRLVETLL